MIEKKASPKGKSVRVTFQLPGDVAQDSVSVVGDFNDWDAQKNPMTKKGDVWSTAISFKPGDTVHFRYYIDGQHWRNDEQADRYSSNEYFSENGVLDL